MSSITTDDCNISSANPIHSFDDDHSKVTKGQRKSVSVYLRSFAIHLVNKNTNQTTVTNRTLLWPVSTVIGGGSMFAILGGSGSGKTTLLNVIAGRFDKNAYKLEGKLLFNEAGANCGIGYVTQSDYLMPFLTVKETILFAAKLRISASDCLNRALALHNVADGIPSTTVQQAYDTLVQEVVLDLGLKECANTRIGDSLQAAHGTRGISGGEKRRVSIAVQVISDPQDEPTSGLDSFTAITVVEALQRLSQGPRRTTVICSIHQPRADVFSMFDSVLLLSKGGRPIYCGPTKELFAYFSALGHACPRDSNPADFFVDLSSEDCRSRETQAKSRAIVRSLIGAYQKQSSASSEVIDCVSADDMTPNHSSPAPHQASWLQQVRLLTGRFATNNYRDSSNMLGGVIQAVCLGLVVMVIFWQLGDSPEDTESMNGLMYIVISMEPYIVNIILVERYCAELRVLDRELQDDMYAPSAYFVAHLLSAAPLLALQPVLYSLPMYYGCNMRVGFSHAVVFMAVNMAVSFTINGMVWMCVAVHRSFTVASLLTNMSFTFITLVAGFLVNPNLIPVYVKWVKNISFLSYAYRLLMTNEYSDSIIPGCPSTDPANCAQYIGNDILASQDIGVNDYAEPCAALCAICVAYYSVAVCLLHFVRHPVTGVVGGELGLGHDEGAVDNEMIDTDDQMKAPTALGADVESQRQTLDVKQGSAVGVTVKIRNVHLSVAVNGSALPPEITSLDSSSKKATVTRAGEKQILMDVSADIAPGRLVALMGGSGSGKTSLLNLIAGRVVFRKESDIGDDFSKPLLKTDTLLSKAASLLAARSIYHGSGEIYFNDLVPSSARLRQMIGYVQQFDFHLPSLTVRETLAFHASMRLDCAQSASQLCSRIDVVLSTLGLQQCADTRVGGEDLKGISGGEKRRLSLGIQLLGDPALCLLDEPTTGLDAFTARHVVETLREIALKGRTVVMSIHQPRYDVFALIDDVVLLARGRQVWSGPSKDMLRHFEAIGYPCPALTNPADFILDISSIDFRSPAKEEASRLRLDVLVAAFSQYTTSHVGQFAALAVFSTAHADGESEDFTDKPLRFCLPLLLHRSYLNSLRQPLVSSTRISQGLFFALILCAFYAPVGDGQDSIQNRIGNLYELTALCFIGMLSCIAIFPAERDVFYREYVDGGYPAVGFFLSYFVLALPFLAVSAVLIALLVTFAIGLQPTGDGLLSFTYVVFCFLLVGECVGVLFCALFLHVGFAVNIMSVVISLFCIMAGYISIDMPVELVYLSYLSPVTWGSYILSNVVFRGATFTCTESEQMYNGQCPLTTGEEVLDLYDMDSSQDGAFGMVFHYWVLGMMTAVFFLLALLVFRVRAYQLSH